jgi:adenylate cyclase class 2
MAKNTEIELKLPLTNGDVLQKLLNSKAKFKYESFQHDVYYNAPHRDFLENSDNVNEWFRIRVAEGKAQINYKDWQPHDEKIKTHCKEFEANVDSYEQLSEILNALNFIKLIEVKKTRKAWDYMDVEISIDSVEELGDFIELEYKGELEDVEAARKHLFEVLETLQAETSELDQRGYPYLLLEKHGLLKED